MKQKQQWYTDKVLFTCANAPYPAQATRWDKCNLTHFWGYIV